MRFHHQPLKIRHVVRKMITAHMLIRHAQKEEEEKKRKCLRVSQQQQQLSASSMGSGRHFHSFQVDEGSSLWDRDVTTEPTFVHLPPSLSRRSTAIRFVPTPPTTCTPQQRTTLFTTPKPAQKGTAHLDVSSPLDERGLGPELNSGELSGTHPTGIKRGLSHSSLRRSVSPIRSSLSRSARDRLGEHHQPNESSKSMPHATPRAPLIITPAEVVASRVLKHRLGGLTTRTYANRTFYQPPLNVKQNEAVLQNDLLSRYGGLLEECPDLLFQVVSKEVATRPSTFQLYVEECQKLSVQALAEVCTQLSSTPGRYRQKDFILSGCPLDLPSVKSFSTLLRANAATLVHVTLNNCNLGSVTTASAMPSKHARNRWKGLAPMDGRNDPRAAEEANQCMSPALQELLDMLGNLDYGDTPLSENAILHASTTSSSAALVCELPSAPATHLSSLNLSSNNLSDADGQALIAFVKHTPSLQRVSIAQNPRISKSVRCAVEAAAAENAKAALTQVRTGLDSTTANYCVTHVAPSDCDLGDDITTGGGEGNPHKQRSQPTSGKKGAAVTFFAPQESHSIGIVDAKSTADTEPTKKPRLTTHAEMVRLTQRHVTAVGTVTVHTKKKTAPNVSPTPSHSHSPNPLGGRGRAPSAVADGGANSTSGIDTYSPWTTDAALSPSAMASRLAATTMSRAHHVAVSSSSAPLSFNDGKGDSPFDDDCSSSGERILFSPNIDMALTLPEVHAQLRHHSSSFHGLSCPLQIPVGESRSMSLAPTQSVDANRKTHPVEDGANVGLSRFHENKPKASPPIQREEFFAVVRSFDNLVSSETGLVDLRVLKANLPFSFELFRRKFITTTFSKAANLVQVLQAVFNHHTRQQVIQALEDFSEFSPVHRIRSSEVLTNAEGNSVAHLRLRPDQKEEILAQFAKLDPDNVGYLHPDVLCDLTVDGLVNEERQRVRNVMARMGISVIDRAAFVKLTAPYVLGKKRRAGWGARL